MWMFVPLISFACFRITHLEPNSCDYCGFSVYSTSAKRSILQTNVLQQAVLEPNHHEEADSLSSVSSNTEESEPVQKPKSRLAMAAEDWLEDDEEDEWVQYWEKFENGKSKRATTNAEETATFGSDNNTVASTGKNSNSNMTTEELLDNYYTGRGIDRKKEKRDLPIIRRAMDNADKATSLQDAIRALQAVQPMLQRNTRLGGETLVKLATLLWENDQEEAAKSILMKDLASNLHVKRDVNRLLRNNGPSKSSSTSSFSKWKNNNRNNPWKLW